MYVPPHLSAHDADSHATPVLLAARESQSKRATFPCPPCKLQNLLVPQVWRHAQFEGHYQRLGRAHGRCELPDVGWWEVQDLGMPFDLGGRIQWVRKDSQEAILPRAWHARKTPSCLPRVHGWVRSAEGRHQCFYMRDTRGGTLRQPRQPRGGDRMRGVKICGI
jgi:hypothetical protein